MSNLTNIITAIRTKDYATANEGVTSLLQQKMADRLAQERRTLGESLLQLQESYCVMCRVSGGMTGEREAPLKEGNKVKVFATQEQAQAKAKELNASRGMNSPVRYAYWVEPYDGDDLDESSVVIGDAPTLPANWKDGFDYPYAIGAGGSETPFLRGNQWYLRVYNTLERKHYLYNFRNDTFELDEAYDPAAEGERAGKLDGAIAAAVKRGDMDKAKELIKRGNADGRKLKLSDFLKEQALPKSEIQRVFNEIGDVGETKLLCGLTHLQVNNGSVEDYRFVVVEASGMNIHGVPFIPATPQPTRVIVDYWTWNAYEGSMNGIRYFSTRAEAEAWVKESKAAAAARKENFDATIKGR